MLDERIDMFFNVVEGVLAFVAEEFDLEIKIVVLDAEIVLSQRADAEAEPAARVWCEVADSRSDGAGVLAVGVGVVTG